MINHNADDVVNINDILFINMTCCNQTKSYVFRLVDGEPDFSDEISQISIHSSMGQALNGKKIGVTYNYEINNNIFSLTILEKLNKSIKK